MDIAFARFLIQLIGVLWLVFVALLALAAIMLVRGSKYRYAVGIVAFSFPATLALVWIIGVGIADSAIMDIIADKVGTWVLFVIPHMVEPTAWPWVVLLVSATCIVALASSARRVKTALASADRATAQE